jgi:putative ABC transport system permease protein
MADKLEIMFRNYLKVALRNLWKNKGYNTVNIFGMAMGFAAFLLILFYVNYEQSYDKIFPHHQLVIKAGMSNGTETGSTMSAGFGPQAAQHFPGISSFTRINYFVEKDLWTVGEKDNYINNLYSVDSTFFDVFQYAFLYGDPSHALDEPHSIVISDAVSHLFFGSQNPVGRRITMNKKTNYTVTGVFKIPDGPTTFHPDAVEKLNTLGRETQLFPMNYYTFFLLKDNVNVPLLRHKLTSFIRKWANKIDPTVSLGKATISLDPITKLHFSDNAASSDVGHSTLLIMLLIIGIILLLIASVNFINLSIASAMGRAKEVGMRKVMGAGKASLKLQFYFEIFIQILVAFILANIFAELLKPAYARFLGMTSFRNAAGAWQLATYCFLALIFVALIAGAYPAFYLSRFDPSRVLKGSFARGKSGTFTQHLLLIFQVTFTTVFLVGLFVMARQIKYLKNINLGFQPDQVLTIPIHTDEAYKKYPSLKTELLNLSGVTAVSRVDNLPNGHGFGGNSYQYKDVAKDMNFLCVDYDFAKTMGMHFVAGRRFDPQRDPDTLGHLILNQAAVKALGITGGPVGQHVTCWYKRKVIGVVNDFHYDNLQKDIQPLVFQLHQGNKMLHVMIRVHTGNIDQTISSIKSIWSHYEPGFPVTYTFLNNYFAKFLKSFERQEKTVVVFASLAILLSLFGLFALVAFSIRKRTKEVAMRNVLGASGYDIFKLLNKDFVWLVVIGNAAGWPLAYFASRHWLNGFAYRIDLPVWPFVIATILSMLLTAAVVSMQAYRAARINPVMALKYE